MTDWKAIARIGIERDRLASAPAREKEHQRTVICMRDHRDHWVVVQRKCNYSAFSGYSYTPSDWSGIRCTECNRYWRTKGAYVDTLPDAPYGVF